MRNQATTAYGFDRMVTALHMGTSGMRSGSNGSQSGGHTHLAMKATKLTACGRRINSNYALIVPLHGLSGEAWADRCVDCSTCRKAMTK
jgi:DNA mismatch repair protein MutH